VKIAKALVKLLLSVAVLVAEAAVAVIAAGFVAALAFLLAKIGWYWV
jgi:hypothetical protein